MSSLEIYGVAPSGDIEFVTELKNSWLGAALVWTRLGDKYLGEFDVVKEWERRRAAGESTSGLDMAKWERTWKLQNDPRITDAEWCVLLSTMDNIIIQKEHFEHAAKCFEEFHESYKDPKFQDSHFGACARIIRELDAKGYIGYCINATSVNQNPWEVPGETEDAENQPYNIFKGTKHWFFDPAERTQRG